MPQSNAADIGGPNLAAVLDTIAWCELGAALIAKSDNGYNVFVGSTASNPNLFDSYDKHPERVVSWIDKHGATKTGTAAGRYQLLAKYWPFYRDQLKLPDFGKLSQDKIALQLIKECGAVAVFQRGDFERGMSLIRSRWASLPGAGYGQHEQRIDTVVAVYKAKGGLLA